MQAGTLLAVHGPNHAWGCASAGLGAALDRTRSTPGAIKLPSQPEFLFSEEALVRKRSWSENLTYYTGVGYLGGACVALTVPQACVRGLVGWGVCGWVCVWLVGEGGSGVSKRVGGWVGWWG